MGFAVYYRSTEVIEGDLAQVIRDAAQEAIRGRTWVSCEPVNFFAEEPEGRLFGGSKPNFEPDPGDVASAEKSGLPDGTPRDLLDVLCLLSREHGVDWEISHSHSGGPIGLIRRGECDEQVVLQITTINQVRDLMRGLGIDFDSDPRFGG